MALYDTATNIINSAAVECGLAPNTNPFTASSEEMVQLRTLLTNCGRELTSGVYQWQQLVKTYSIDTGPIPVTDGRYDLPADFGYFINQTGWSPTAAGNGLPLGGPLSEQIWAAIVATNLAASVIYVSFKIADRVLQVLPAPAPANTEITFSYVSQNWVLVNGSTTTATQVANTGDIVLFDAVMMVKMLATRYKQAKGLDATSSAQQFQAMFAAFTGTNTTSPILNMTRYSGYPLINVWTNVPQSGYGL
jgi:hypothetical protein